MTDQETEQSNLTVGKEVVNVEYTGDYYHPFKYELEDGTVIMGVVT